VSLGKAATLLLLSVVPPCAAAALAAVHCAVTTLLLLLLPVVLLLCYRRDAPAHRATAMLLTLVPVVLVLPCLRTINFIFCAVLRKMNGLNSRYIAKDTLHTGTCTPNRGTECAGAECALVAGKCRQRGSGSTFGTKVD